MTAVVVGTYWWWWLSRCSGGGGGRDMVLLKCGDWRRVMVERACRYRRGGGSGDVPALETWWWWLSWRGCGCGGDVFDVSHCSGTCGNMLALDKWW